MRKKKTSGGSVQKLVVRRGGYEPNRPLPYNRGSQVFIHCETSSRITLQLNISVEWSLILILIGEVASSKPDQTKGYYE
jgi:hypothetical protein